MFNRRLGLFVMTLMGLLLSGLINAADSENNVLITDSFEMGTNAPDGWQQGAEVEGVKYLYERDAGSEGKRSISLQKSANRYFPIAQWSRRFKHTSDKTGLKVATKIRAIKATKAVVDVLFLDESGKWIKHEWVSYIGQKKPSDPLATHDWKTYEGTLEIPKGTKEICIAFQIYGPGQVWFDELDARYVDAPPAKKSGN
jgi:hypothetical protein